MIAVVVSGLALLCLYVARTSKRGLLGGPTSLRDWGPPPPSKKVVNDPPLPAPPAPVRISNGAMLPPPPAFAARSTMPVPREVTEVRLPDVGRLEGEVRRRLIAARKHLDQAEREFEHGKPALALEDVTLTSAALVDLHWPLMRLAGAKP